MTGKAPAGGFDFQSRLAAWVAVRILARRPLNWSQSVNADVPVAVSAETGGTGDDLRIELAGSEVVYECQAKRGLSANRRLDEAIDDFADGLPSKPEERGILLVDPTSARTITEDLRDGLDRWRQQVRSKPEGVLARALNRLEQQNALAVAERVHVVMMDIEQDASAMALNALVSLEHLLDDGDQATAAWGVLVADGLRLCREGGRRDYQNLVRILGQANIAVGGGLPTAGSQRNQILEGIRDIQSVLIQSHLIATPSTPDHAHTDRHTVQLDTAKALLEEGRTLAALDLLNSLAEATAPVDDAVRLRRYNLAAAALLRLDRLGLAREELERALAIDPANTTALANLAQTELLDGNRNAALQHADRLLAHDPHSLSAWSVILQAREGVEVPAELRDTPEVLSTLSFISARAGRYEEAIDFARRALAHGFEPDRAMLLAQALYARAFESGPASEHREDLEEVLALTDEVAAALRPDQQPGLLEQALLICGQAARLLGDQDRARDAFDQAHRLAPAAPRSAYLLGLSYLEAGKPEEALFLIDRVPDLARDPLIATMRARALLQAGRSDEAQAALQVAATANEGNAHSLDVEHMIIELALEAGFTSFADSQLAKKEETSGWLWFLFRARLAAQHSDDPTAKNAFEQAISGADDGSRPLVQGEYAEYLRSGGDARKAVEVLEMAGADTNPTIRPLYARALLQAGHYAAAAALLKRVEAETSNLPPWALRTGASVALVREDLPQAISYLEALRAALPTDSDVSLRLALVLAHHRDTDRAIEVLDQVVTQDLTSRELVTAAELYIRAGRPENALALAYQALRKEPDSADIQLAYVNLFVQRENEQPDLDAHVVRTNTAVVLSVEGETDSEYFIVDQDAPDRQVGELSPSDPFAKQLLDKRQGDRITLRPGSMTEREAVIKEIKSHYVHAFQSILSNFPSRYPDNVQLQSFKLPDNPTAQDLQPLAAIAAQRQEQANKALEVYAANWLPLGVIASGTSTSLAAAYWLVASQTKYPLLVELSDSQSAASTAAATARTMVITRTALITMQQVDLFDTVADLDWKMMVPQSLLDELDEERAEIASHTREGRLSIESSEQGPVPRSIPADRFREELRRFDEMRSWLELHCSVEARPLAFLEPDNEQMREAVGRSSFDSIALAKAKGATLYADDSGLRRLLVNGASDGFSTFALAGALLQQGVIDQGRYDEIVGQLHLLNHQNLVLSPRAVRVALAKLDYVPRGPVVKFFERLREPDLAPQQIVTFTVGLLREIATSPNALGQLPALAVALADVAIGNRPLDRIIQMMRVAVETAFALLPHEKDVVLGCIARVADTRRRSGSP